MFERRRDRSRLLRRGSRVLSGLVVAAAVVVPLTTTSAYAATAPGSTGPDTTVTPSDWTSAGGNADDTHDSATETTISPGNVSNLQEKWSYTTTGGVRVNFVGDQDRLTDPPRQAAGVWLCGA
jgi:glucose dehydrogenase